MIWPVPDPQNSLPREPCHLRDVCYTDSCSDHLLDRIEATLSVLGAYPKDVLKIRALGLIGLLAMGMHHQHHHLSMATGHHPHRWTAGNLDFGILSTRIDYDDGTASIELLRSVAEFFMPLADADQVVSDCIQVIRKWRDFARRRVALIAEVNRMETAFEPRV